MKKFDGTPSKKKFKGYDYYIQCNDKLSKKNRKSLLRTSPKHLSEVRSKLMISEERELSKLVFDLDPNLNDWELLDQWNMMYENFGYLMTKFRKKWEDSRIKDFGKETFKPSIEFEELVQRVSKLEGQMMSMRFKNINTLG
jgi:hypothetical protein